MTTMISRRDFLEATAIVPAVGAMRQRRRGVMRVAVIGAGAFGGWTALHLRRAGAHVELVDAWGPGNARASSGGETRVIRAIYGNVRRHVEMAARALAMWQAWDRGRVEKCYRRTGVLWMTGADDSYPRQSLPLLRDRNLACVELSVADAA